MMTAPGALRGFANTSFYADDLPAASAWYSQVFGFDPYFVMDGYIEFRVGDFQHELGIIDAAFAPPGVTGSPGGAIVYWHVDDVNAALERLLGLGATLYQPIIERGQGFTTAAVVDPFGNILGVMQNPHYLEILEGLKPAG